MILSRLKSAARAVWKPRVPLALFVLVVGTLGIMMGTWAFGENRDLDPDRSVETPPKGYSVVELPDLAYSTRQESISVAADRGWICWQPNASNVRITCYVPDGTVPDGATPTAPSQGSNVSDGVTFEKIVAVLTVLIALFAALAPVVTWAVDRRGTSSPTTP